jgi:hypothetical protein
MEMTQSLHKGEEDNITTTEWRIIGIECKAKDIQNM